MIIRKRFIINKKSLTIFFWFMIVYLFSGSPYTTINTEISMLTIVLALVVLPYVLLLKRMKMKGTITSLSLIFIMIVIPMIWHSEIQSRTYWRVLATAIIAFYLLEKYGLDNIINIYLKAMVVISIASLIGYILLNCTPLLNNLPTAKNINGVEYGIGILFNYIKVYPERNCGVFWEPGIFASY